MQFTRAVQPRMPKIRGGRGTCSGGHFRHPRANDRSANPDAGPRGFLKDKHRVRSSEPRVHYHASPQECPQKHKPNTPMKKLAITVLTAATLGSFIVTALAGKPAKTEAPTVVSIAAGNKDFSTLVAAVKAAGLVDTLNGDGPFTIFAPTNEAFAKLPKGTVEDLLKPENKEKLTAILTYHVIAGKVMAADVKAGKVKTVQGGELEIATEGGVTVNGAKVVKTDLVGKNGVIHVIDTVVLPK